MARGGSSRKNRGREEGEGDLGAKLPENIFDHALFSLRNRLFAQRDWPLLHEEAL